MQNWPVLTLSSFNPDSESYFYSNTFTNHIEKHHLHVLSPHKHTFFVCVCFTAGSGWHEIDFKRYPIERGSLFILSPGQTHNWQFTAGTEGYVILHSLEFILHYLPGASLHKLPFLRKNDPLNYIALQADQLAIIEPYFQHVLHDYIPGNPFWRQTCSAYLSLIYHEAARFLPPEENEGGYTEKYQEAYLQFLALLDQFYTTEHTADNYAHKMNISSRHLNRITVGASGLSAGKIIAGKLLLEAQRLLADNTKTLTGIGEFLGFNEYSYFSRWFKKQTGVSPERFRKRYQGLSS